MGFLKRDDGDSRAELRQSDGRAIRDILCNGQKMPSSQKMAGNPKQGGVQSGSKGSFRDTALIRHYRTFSVLEFSGHSRLASEDERGPHCLT